MTAHAPEPMRVEDAKEHICCYSAALWRGEKAIGEISTKEEAENISAAVNACAGMDDPEAAMIVLRTDSELAREFFNRFPTEFKPEAVPNVVSTASNLTALLIPYLDRARGDRIWLDTKAVQIAVDDARAALAEAKDR